MSEHPEFARDTKKSCCYLFSVDLGAPAEIVLDTETLTQYQQTDSGSLYDIVQTFAITFIDCRLFIAMSTTSVIMNFMENDLPRNLLLRHLPQAVLADILSVAEYVHLDLREHIIEPNKPIQYVDFPDTGVMSLLAPIEDGPLIEIATIGNEGMVGVSVALGVFQIEDIAFCQVVGSSYRIKTADFLELLERHSSLRTLCNRYAMNLFAHVSRNTACNRAHSIDQRCARWLLMTSDRCGSRDFMLTQEFLSVMLAVSRTGVNLAASTLAKASLITYVRGKISILDVPGLERASCQCYSVMKGYSGLT